jgi:uncharacterized protein (TIGR02996 family)
VTTADALLAAVLANPEDDLPRLMLADHLEERNGPGDAERSEFIRVQCAVWSYPARWLNPHARYGEYADLKRREWVLWHSVPAVGDWFRPFAPIKEQPGVCLSADWGRATIHRGFIAEVRCTLAEWCGGVCGRCRGDDGSGGGVDWVHDCPACSGTGRTAGIGPRVVAAHPVERVVLSDREPVHIGSNEGERFWMWLGDDTPPMPFGDVDGLAAHRIPRAVLDCGLITDYEKPTREAATDALSATLIAWSRSQTTAPARSEVTP